jgi:hypothetical protein
MYDYSTRQIGFNGFMLTGLPLIDGSNKQRSSGGISTFGFILILIGGVGFILTLVYFAMKKRQEDNLRQQLIDMYEKNQDDEDAE